MTTVITNLTTQNPPVNGKNKKPPINDGTKPRHRRNQSVPETVGVTVKHTNVQPHYPKNHFDTRTGRDEWDMPVVADGVTSSLADDSSSPSASDAATTTSKSSKKQGTNNRRKPKQIPAPPSNGLTWQQAQLSLCSKSEEELLSRPHTAKSASLGKSTSSGSRKKQASGPQNSSLTWQQDMLKNLNIKSETNNRMQNRDNETFGGLPGTPKTSPGVVFATPPRRSSGFKIHSSANPKDKPTGENKYAGPAFHNSPAPSSLPTPAFLKKRTSGSDNETSH